MPSGNQGRTFAFGRLDQNPLWMLSEQQTCLPSVARQYHHHVVERQETRILLGTATEIAQAKNGSVQWQRQHFQDQRSLGRALTKDDCDWMTLPLPAVTTERTSPQKVEELGGSWSISRPWWMPHVPLNQKARLMERQWHSCVPLVHSYALLDCHRHHQLHPRQRPRMISPSTRSSLLFWMTREYFTFYLLCFGTFLLCVRTAQLSIINSSISQP